MSRIVCRLFKCHLLLCEQMTPNKAIIYKVNCKRCKSEFHFASYKAAEFLVGHSKFFL